MVKEEKHVVRGRHAAIKTMPLVPFVGKAGDLRDLTEALREVIDNPERLREGKKRYLVTLERIERSVATLEIEARDARSAKRIAEHSQPEWKRRHPLTDEVRVIEIEEDGEAGES